MKISKCQGDHGRYGANYRCCLPALAGFVSPHSMGPGGRNLRPSSRRFKEKQKKSITDVSQSLGAEPFAQLRQVETCRNNGRSLRIKNSFRQLWSFGTAGL